MEQTEEWAEGLESVGTGCSEDRPGAEHSGIIVEARWGHVIRRRSQLRTGAVRSLGCCHGALRAVLEGRGCGGQVPVCPPPPAPEAGGEYTPTPPRHSPGVGNFRALGFSERVSEQDR